MISIKLAIIFMCVGIIIEAIATYFIFCFRTEKGVMLIDHSDPEKDICRIDLNNKLDRKTKKFILKIDHNAKLSQE